MNILLYIFGSYNTRKRKFIYSVILLIIVFYFAGLANIISHNKGIQMGEKIFEPLQDLGFEITNEITPNLKNYLVEITNYVTVGLVIFCTIWILLFNKNNRYHILTHYCVMLSILFAIRIITILSTILPRPWPKGKEWPTCLTEKKFNGNLWLRVPDIVLKQRFTCFDFCYSGHTVFVVLACLIITKWSNRKLLISIIWILTICNLYCIIGVRAHYTIDVEIGLVLTILFWMIKKYQIELNTGLFSWWFNLENNQANIVQNIDKTDNILEIT